MTCAAAYRPKRRPDRRNLNSQYAVLAVDGRITDDHGTIYTDKAVKWACAGPLVCVLAGDLPAMQKAIRRLLGAAKGSKLESVQGACQVLFGRGKAGVTIGAGAKGAPAASDLGWSALIYHSGTHDLFTVDSDGSVMREEKRIAAIGTGSEVAIGHLLACGADGPNWSEAQAKLNLRGAIKSAARRNSSVGPRATVLFVRADGRVSVRG